MNEVSPSGCEDLVVLVSERVKGIEPSYPAWKAGALTVVLHPPADHHFIVRDPLVVVALLPLLAGEEWRTTVVRYPPGGDK